MIDEITKQTFQTTVWEYYRAHGRAGLPWRGEEVDGSFDPYVIMVSEIMLQQTQVARVIPKYRDFLWQFPSLARLAEASLSDVLRVWNGLGYNRRAKFLHQAAQQIVTDYGGIVPDQVDKLVELPGIGKNTAAAILAYAFNRPVVFVETNIRTVYIHHFFNDQIDVPDNAIRKIVEQTLDSEQPREWYWALMDYGSYLKQEVGNLNKLSKSYTAQSTFHGSRRQLRGKIIRILLQKTSTVNMLSNQIPDDRLQSVISELIAEGLVRKHGRKLSL